MRREYTKQLVEFVLDTKSKNIPKEAFHLCKRHFLDCTAACLSAMNSKTGKIVKNYFAELQSTNGARVIGCDLRTSIDNAAFANGILSHAVSFDDSGPSHPSVTIVPPLYALGENLHLDGETILTAQVLAYEVFQKLNLVTKDAWEMRDRGWHPTGFFGAVTSSLIASKLLKLNLKQALNAVGIAASMGAGLTQNIGNMTMSMHAGNASRNGIIAAKFAREGFTGDQDILEGRFGLMNALSGVDNYDIEALVTGLGAPFSVINPGINLKPYPNCWAHHRVYDATIDLANTYDINPSDVACIECDLQPCKPTYRYLDPKTDLEAKYSLGYGIAICLQNRTMGLDHYNPEQLNAPAIKSIIAKIKHVSQSDASEKHKITIKLNSGDVYSKAVEHSKGHALFKPLSDAELIEKYNNCAQGTLPEEKIKRSIQLICEMQDINDMNLIMDTLTV